MRDGRLPQGWARVPVYARYSVQLGKMLDERRIVGNYLAPYLRNVDVQWNEINVCNLPEMDFNEVERETFSLRKGDLLVCEGGEVGRTAIWRGELAQCFYQKALHRLRPITNGDDPRFFRYFMWMAVESELFQGTTTSTIQHLTAEKLRVVRYPAPPLSEQTAIADYLDRETARLDALVAAKEHLLALLAEKRRALVTRAVTRGLDPNVPMRDSGVPWLGEVPAHWEVERLKFHLEAIEQGWSPQCESHPAAEGEWGVLKAGCVNGHSFNSLENKKLPDGLVPPTAFEVLPGDLLMSRANTTSLVGSAALATQSPARLLLCDKLYRLRVRETRLLKAFLLAFLRSPPGRSEFERDASGASNSMQNIGQDSVRNLWVPVPTAAEQSAILQHLDKETRQLAQVAAATERSLSLLKERRGALISAAVTGRMVVPGGRG